MYDDIVTNKRRWRMVNNKHDSYCALVPEAEAPEAARAMNGYMAQRLVGRDGVEFTMRSEVQIGRNFKKYHKEKNPLGMKDYTV
jgi:hypothetical protein